MSHFDQTPRVSEPPKTLSDLWETLLSIFAHLARLKIQLERNVPEYQNGSATFDPANLVDGAGATTTVTVTGSVLGDLAFASFSLDLQGITLTAWVSANGTVSVRFQNESGGALDLGEGTLRAWTLRPPVRI